MDTTEREGRVIKIATIPADTFAHRLLLVRAQLNHMTVKDAAERCGLNYGSWSKWERGALPRDILDVADAVATGLDIDKDWLLHGGPLTKPERQPRRRLRLTYARRSIRPGDHGPRRPRRLDRGRAVAA
jgi:transcriptional regulator with XRE-family HTH domain